MKTTEQIVNEKVEAFRLQLLKELVDKFIILGYEQPISFELATESEVLDALTKEYHKRGYERGYFKDVRDGKVMNNAIKEDIVLSEGGLWVRGCGFVFDKGKWAEIIPKEKTTEDYIKDMRSDYVKDSSIDPDKFYTQWLKQNDLSITKNK